jgi:hypothetical protein
MNVKIVVFEKGHNGTCKFEFPYFPHVELISFLYKKTNKWEYYKPQYEDQNVMPYHPTLLLLWQAHLDILHITYSYWSFYF